MASTNNYAFQNMARIGLDNCYTQQRDIENASYATYMTQNYFANDCSMAKPRQLATMQPGIMYSGGYGSGAGGCNIDDSSRLLIGTIQTHPKCKIDLFSRPFATVPYIGKGSINVCTESMILQGENTLNRKSINPLGQTQTFSFYPPVLAEGSQARMDNYYNALSAVPRSGINSKDMYRDTSGTGPFGGKR